MPAALVSGLRNARWLGPERARGYRLLLALMSAAAAAGWIARSRGGIDPAGKPLGTDFLAFWSAARLALAGTPAAAWDLATIGAAERASVAVDPGLSSFLYPPTFLLACLPFGLLPYFAALPVWLALTGGAYLLAIRRWLVPHRGALITIAAFPAMLSNAGHGQNGFLTAALLGGGLWLVERRPWLAGAMLGALIVKPQLALALPVLVLAGGRWRVLWGALASAGALGLIATIAFGAEVWRAFLDAAPVGRAILDQGLVDPAKMVSLFAAARVLDVPAGIAFVVQGTGAFGAALLLAHVARARRIAPGGAAALAGACTALMSPFLLDYDLTITAIPLAWLFSAGVRRGFMPWDKLVLGAGYLLPLVARPVAQATGVPLAPVVLWALALAVARAAMRDGTPA